MLSSTLDMLGIFSNKPEFNKVLHVGKPNIGDRKKLYSRIDDMLDRAWLTNNGPFVQEMEKRVSDYLNVKHCIAMCNGTVALEIVTRALDMSGEVIVPSLTFVATAHAIQWQGMTPVFCDVDPVTCTIDPKQIERFITPRTTGIIGVHLWGKPCHIEEIEKIARKHDLKLVYDASHAFGCSYKKRRIGAFGDAETFSFHATKFLNSFEGGAVVTNNDELAEKIRYMKNFGFEGMDNVMYVGTNGKMSEISAAMGLTSLDQIDYFISINKKNYNTYRNYLENINGVQIREIDKTEDNNYQYILIDVDQEKTRMSRDLLMKILHAENIRARRYFFPGCHRMEPYRSYFPNTGVLLPVTEKMAERLLCLPTGTGITSEDIDKICSLIRFSVENSIEIIRRLKSEKNTLTLDFLRL